MFAQINHMAVISQEYPLLERFYRAHFKLMMTSRSDHDAEASSVMGDGYVGLNIIPRRDGYMVGFDHFGMVVDSVDTVLERMTRSRSKARIIKRPSTRPFAAYSGHDPDGNVFDLAQKNGENLKDVYAQQKEQGWDAGSGICFNRFAIRTMNAKECADFYAEVFELKPARVPEGRPGYHLTDGRVVLSLTQWNIDDFADMSIKRPGPDHVGVKVPDLEAFKNEVARIAGKNTYLAPRPLGGSKESDTRRRFFEGSALGKMQIADTDGNWIDLTDE